MLTIKWRLFYFDKDLRDNNFLVAFFLCALDNSLLINGILLHIIFLVSFSQLY